MRDTKEILIKSAIDIIVKEGIENLSVNATLRLADVSKGSFYYHYNNLDELLMDTSLNVMKYFFDQFLFIDNELTADKIKKIGRKIIKSNEDSKKMETMYFLLLSKTFSNKKIKKMLIKKRKEHLIKLNKKFSNQKVLLLDILITGFLAQKQVFDSYEKLLKLWDSLVDNYFI